MASTTSLTNVAYLVLISTIVAFLIMIFLIYRPLLNEINIAQAEVKKQELLLQEKQDFIKTINQKIALLRTQTQYEEQLKTVLPDDKRIQDVLEVIHQAAATHGVQVSVVTEASSTRQNDINVAQSRGEGGTITKDIDIVGVNITVESSYAGFRGFLTDLERSPRLLDVESINMSSIDQTADRVSATMLLTAYAHGK